MSKADPIPQPLPQVLGKGSRCPSPVSGRGTDLSEAKSQGEGRTQAEILKSILSRRFCSPQNAPSSLELLQEDRWR